MELQHVSGENITGLCDVAVYERRYLEMFPNILSKCRRILYVGEDLPTDIIESSYSFFVKTDYIDYFENNVMPLIKSNFILITHNSDYLSGLNKNIINNPHIVKWYGQNMIPNDKTSGIPIGLENSAYQGWDYNYLISQKSDNKEYMLYVNFSINTNKKRKGILECLKRKGYDECQKKPWKEYIKELSKYKFAVSPEGNGVDCHRIWECIYLGCIPIVEDNEIIKTHFGELPILFVSSYDVINDEYLNREYDKFKTKSFNVEKTTLKYWRDVITHQEL